MASPTALNRSVTVAIGSHFHPLATAMKVQIYSNKEICIDFTISRNSPVEILAITFTERGNRALNGPGFGAEFLTKRGIDVISIKTCRDAWYQNLEPEILSDIALVLSRLRPRYQGIAGYGSSMGAYAAIRFSKPLALDRVLALSPVHGIHYPWDTRWAQDLTADSCLEPITKADIGPKTRFFNVYDPKSLDARHAELYRRIIAPDALHEIHTPYSGHPSSYFLRDVGILSELATTIIKTGSFPCTKIKRPHSERPAPETYLFNLANACLERHKPKIALALAEQLLERNACFADFHMIKAKAFHQLGQCASALDACHRAADLNPSNPHYLLFAKHYLMTAD
jgi:hypothetical protein